MRKIFTLFILLLLLPTTALAAAPSGQVLYVGGVQISNTGYWTTDSDGNVTPPTEGGTPSNNYIHYDAEDNILTLRNATIKNALDYGNNPPNSLISGAAIGVLNQKGAAELTITLEGTNTIAEVGKGIFVLASSTGGATLTITGGGSLDASVSSSRIQVQSNSGDATLTIRDADVEAEVTGSSGDGVLVQAGQSSNASLSVNGGSLTATGSGTYGAGIRFLFGSIDSSSRTPSLTVSGNAMVKASSDTGGITSNSSPVTPSGTGIVFNNGTGTVYGSVTLQEDLTIGEGESLTLDNGASLDAGDYDVIVDGGTLDENLANSLGNNVKYAPAITNHPQNVEVKENETATFTIVVTGTEPLSYQWQQSTDKGSSWMDITGETNASYTIATTTTYMNDTQYRCVVSNSAGSVESHAATLTVNAKPTYTITAVVVPEGAGSVKVNDSGTSASVAAGSPVTLNAAANEGYRFTGWMENDQQVSTNATYTFNANGDRTLTAKFEKKVTGVTLNPTLLSLFTGGSETLTATVEPSDAANQYVTWATSDDTVVTVQATGNGTAIVTAVAAGTATITVTTEDGTFTATCKVTVTHSMVHTPKKDATCTADGNEEYWTCEICGKYFSDEAGTTEISLAETVIPATGHHYVNGTCTVCGEKDPDYRPDPISYYNIYVEDVCDGVEVSTSKQVVREGGSITVYVEKDTANYTFDNFKVYYKRSYYGGWEELKEGTQPGEYPIKNIWTHIYIKAEGAEEKEDPTGIESIEGVKVYTKDGSLYVQTPQREQVIIVSMSGVVVKNEEQVGLKQYHGLQPGIYIVRVGDRAYKLRLN